MPTGPPDPRLLDRLLAAQERDSARLAAHVHDDAVQTLAAVELRLGLLRGAVARHDPGLGEQVHVLQDLVSGVVDGLRDLLVDLEPTAPGTPTGVLLREVAEQALAGSDTRLRLDLDPVGRTHHVLGDLARAQLVRALRAVLAGVRRRASRQALLVARLVDDGLQVRVEDDGHEPAREPAREPGWEPGWEPGGDADLADASDRAAALGGTLDVVASPGGGVTATLWLPSAVR